MRGIGEPHAQTGRLGFLVSGRLPGQMCAPPTDSGNRHDQQTSVIGLTNLPVQLAGSALAGAGSSANAAIMPSRVSRRRIMRRAPRRKR